MSEAASAQACTPNLLHSDPITYTYRCNEVNIKKNDISKKEKKDQVITQNCWQIARDNLGLTFNLVYNEQQYSF